MVTGKACLRDIWGKVTKAMANYEKLVLRKNKGKINPCWILKCPTSSRHLAALWRDLPHPTAGQDPRTTVSMVVKSGCRGCTAAHSHHWAPSVTSRLDVQTMEIVPFPTRLATLNCV